MILSFDQSRILETDGNRLVTKDVLVFQVK